MHFRASTVTMGWNRDVDSKRGRPWRRVVRGIAPITFCIALVFSTPRSALAVWSTEFAPPGIFGDVFCAIELEGDLIVGGRFTIAGHARVQNIARWDGTEFHPLGEFDDEIRAFAIHEGKLVVGGRFGHVDGIPASVAILEESGWRPFGGLLENRVNPIRYGVFALFSDGGDLYAGGEFTHAGGEHALSLARWSGSRWEGLPASLPGIRPVVWTMTSYEESLIVGGEFVATGADSLSNLAAWNGTRWEDIGGGVPGPVRALLAQGDSLVVGGRFTRPGDPAARNVALWSGATWSPLGGGLFGGDEVVETLTLHRGDLHAGGSFALAEGTHANKVGRWDGDRWFDLGAGVVGDGEVHQLLPFRNVLICVGRFSQLSGNVAHSIGQWTGFWNPLLRSQGMDDRVRAFAEYDGAIIAAGRFQRAGGGATSAEIVRWDGSRWNDMQAGVNDEATDLAVEGGLLFAVGSFIRYAGGVSRHAIVYDGTTWTDPRGGAGSLIRTIGSYDGRVVIGGEFLRAGGRPAIRIAQWNGQLWEGLAEGLDDAPEALLARGDTLIVGGRFLRAGTQEAPYLAAWNPTRRWEPFAEALNGPVLALSSFRGSLVAAGAFTGTAERSLVLGRVARWSQAGWNALGSGFDGEVEVLAEHSGRLVAGGKFSHADGKPARGLAFWDGASWNALAGGVAGADSIVYALRSDGASLWVGGSFTQVGGSVSAHVARWDGDLPVEVWPGDTDDDGSVDARDLLPIGRFFGLEGPARASGSREWNAQAVPDWEDNRAARADADGNGRVDAEDVRALVENWERSRFSEGSASSPEMAAAILLESLPMETNGHLQSLRRVLASYLSPRERPPIEASTPFHPGDEIRLRIPFADLALNELELELFDVRGRRIHRFPIDASAGRDVALRWNGRLENGPPAAAGVYFLRLRLGGREASALRIVLIR